MASGKFSTDQKFVVDHATVGQWEDTEDLRQQDGQVIGTRKVSRDRPNVSHVFTGPELVKFLGGLELEHGETLRIRRDDDAVPDSH